MGGRTLGADVPSMNLKAGDRLEPSIQLVDVADFSATPTPFVAKFWRATFYGDQCVDSVNHRNPLFDPLLHVSPSVTFALDVLHILYLGIFQRLMAGVLWEILKGNPFKIATDDVIAGGLEYLRTDLSRWYSENKIDTGSRIGDITKGMLGKAGGKQMHRKLGEGGRS